MANQHNQWNFRSGLPPTVYYHCALNCMEFNAKKIFVGNLPFTSSKGDLEQLFASYGKIVGVNIREDRATGKPKGFAFVTFEEEESAVSAIAAMNNYSYGGRNLTVNLASIRGSDAAVPRKEVDNSWKTVPTPPPSQQKNAKGSGKKAATTGGPKPRATWDQWAGPVQKKQEGTQS